MILDEEGGVWSFGHPENGTLGHNDDGKFMAKANKVDFRYVEKMFISENKMLLSNLPQYAVCTDKNINTKYELCPRFFLVRFVFSFKNAYVVKGTW